jgi:hypothetical protein
MKTIFKTFLIFLIFQIPSKELYSQDSSKYFIGYDLFKGIINEPSFTFGYNLTRHHFITFSLGYTYDNKNLRDNFRGLSPSQDKYPFLVYNGPTFRTSYEFRIVSFFYFGADFYYKYLSYTNHTFYDSEGDYGDVTFTRDEKANVFGWHVNSGFMITIPKIHLLINPSIGLGETIKSRTYTTTNSTATGERYEDVPLGTYSKELQYFSVMMNLNIAITIGK